jgi:hypothetical protein
MISRVVGDCDCGRSVGVYGGGGGLRWWWAVGVYGGGGRDIGASGLPESRSRMQEAGSRYSICIWNLLSQMSNGKPALIFLIHNPPAGLVTFPGCAFGFIHFLQ